jgi:hypothetical protein
MDTLALLFRRSPGLPDDHEARRAGLAVLSAERDAGSRCSGPTATNDTCLVL